MSQTHAAGLGDDLRRLVVERSHDLVTLIEPDGTIVYASAAWETLLLAAGWLCWRRGWAKVATGFALAAAAHFAWFALVLHNPLWSGQAVGAVPVANLLVPAYAVGFAVILVLLDIIRTSHQYAQIWKTTGAGPIDVT